MFTRWSDELLTGDEVIDKQHQTIFQRAEELINSAGNGCTRDQSVTLINYLEGYYFSHFAAEEALQVKYGDPNHEAHKRAHEALSQRVAQLKEEAAASANPQGDCVNVMLFMLGWLAEHIGLMDKALARHIRTISSVQRAPVTHPQ